MGNVKQYSYRNAWEAMKSPEKFDEVDIVGRVIKSIYKTFIKFRELLEQSTSVD